LPITLPHHPARQKTLTPPLARREPYPPSSVLRADAAGGKVGDELLGLADDACVDASDGDVDDGDAIGKSVVGACDRLRVGALKGGDVLGARDDICDDGACEGE